MKLQTQVNLQGLNTLSVPAVAEFFVECASVEEIREALNWARENKKVFRVLAGGSNVVLADFLPGLTLAPKLLGISILQETHEGIVLNVGAGENWHELVTHSVEQGWFGLENLALIPGSVGAAPIQNIGAYGVEVKEFIQTVTTLDTQNLEEHIFNKQDCHFEYRESVFKNTDPGRYMVTSVTFCLSKIENALVTYPALIDFLKIQAWQHTAANIMKAVIAIRQSKLPDPAVMPNAGSFFKNPVISALRFLELGKAYPEIIGFAQENAQVKIAAAWLIEQCGWKGRDMNGVSVHAEHALVLINTNKKSAKEILALAEKIVSDVKKKFAIELEQEPRYLE